MKPIQFSFKSQTPEGNAARIEVSQSNDGFVIISKIITSKEDLTKYGFTLMKKHKWFSVYRERIILKKSSLFVICDALKNI